MRPVLRGSRGAIALALRCLGRVHRESVRREFKAVLTLGVSGGDWRKGQGAPEVLLAYQGAGYMGK